MISNIEDCNRISITNRRNLAKRIALLDEKKFKELQNNIKGNSNEIQQKYNELCQIASPIERNEYLGGLIKCTNVEKSLEGLLSIIQGVAKSTLGAFQGNSKNLEAILDLMKISISFENDLYQQLDDCDCSKENIANLLHDLCSQYNIDSKAIEGLFEQSFNRTVTLRARINNLREDIFERISKYEEKFEHFDETIQHKEEEFTSEFDSKTAAYTYQLENLIKDCLSDVNSYKKELEKAKNSYKLEIESLKCHLVDSIKQYNEEIAQKHDMKFEQYKKINTELNNQIDLLNKDVSKLQSHLIWSYFLSSIAILIAIIGFII